MGKELETVFAKGGAPWTVKYYKEKVLSALTLDLARRDEEGLEDHVCKKVFGALQAAVEIVKDIEDGGAFFKHFHENLAEFKDQYYQWNSVSDVFGRRKHHNSLTDKKKAMFQTFYDKMKKLKKVNDEERVKQFQILIGTQGDRMDKLNRTFATLASDHGDIFVELKEVMKEFNKHVAKRKPSSAHQLN